MCAYMESTKKLLKKQCRERQYDKVTLQDRDPYLQSVSFSLFSFRGCRLDVSSRKKIRENNHKTNFPTGKRTLTKFGHKVRVSRSNFGYSRPYVLHLC